MIIVDIHSGLGNQLFPICICKKLFSIKRNLPLKLNLSPLRDQETALKRSIYRLSYYNINENFATAEEIAKIRRTEFNSLGYKVIRKITNRKLRLYKNNSYQVDQFTYYKDNINSKQKMTFI